MHLCSRLHRVLVQHRRPGGREESYVFKCTQWSIILASHFHSTLDLCRYAMRELHPFLGAAVGLQGGSSVHMTVHPLQLHLPADCYTVRIQPMKVIIGSNAFLSSLMGLLKLR